MVINVKTLDFARGCISMQNQLVTFRQPARLGCVRSLVRIQSSRPSIKRTAATLAAVLLLWPTASTMTQTTISSIAPFFIVADVPATLSFYRDKLGFEVTFRGPSPEDEFFGIVRRDGAMIIFKALGVISDGKEIVVEPVPNFRRKPAFSWDAYLEVPDPEALAAEFASRGVRLSVPLTNGDDGVTGFVIEDLDGYGLFFGHYRA